MSAERMDGCYIAICDYCGDELPEEPSFHDAAAAKEQARWGSIKKDAGWLDYCPTCYTGLYGAAADFAVAP